MSELPPETPETPWYKNLAVWVGVVTILSLVLGAFGYNVTADDQQQLVVGLSGVSAGVANLVLVFRNILNSKK